MAYRDYKIPDVNAPRVRPKVARVDNNEFLSELHQLHPELASKLPTIRKLRKFIIDLHTMMHEYAIDHRDGIELPLMMGHIFIGVYRVRPTQRSLPVDRKVSQEYEKELHHDNFHSDSYSGKIYYTNWKGKGRPRIQHGECWCFDGCRNFSRKVKGGILENWKKYAVVTDDKFLKKVLDRHHAKHYYRKVDNEKKADYDEFKFDD